VITDTEIWCDAIDIIVKMWGWLDIYEAESGLKRADAEGLIKTEKITVYCFTVGEIYE